MIDQTTPSLFISLIGTPLNGTIVSLTENYAFVDVGVVKEVPGLRKPRRINGQLYRLDLFEKYAISSKYKGAKTEAVLERGMNLQVRARRGIGRARGFDSGSV